MPAPPPLLLLVLLVLLLLQVMREVSSRARTSDTGAEAAADGAHNCCFEISQEAEEHAQRDFVACRRSDRSLKAEDLHRWLTMARLFALSHGDTKVGDTTTQTLVDRPDTRRDQGPSPDRRAPVCVSYHLLACACVGWACS